MTVREQLEQKYGKASSTPQVGSVRASLEAKYKKTEPTVAVKDINIAYGKELKPTQTTGVAGFSEGIGKGILGTIRGATSLSEKALSQTAGRISNLVSGKGFTPTKTYTEQIIPKELVEATTTSQKFGKGAEQFAEFLVPGSASLKLGKAASTAVKGGKLLKGTVGLGTTSLAEGALGTGQSALQSGKVGKEEAITGIVSLAIPPAIAVAGKTLKIGAKTASKILPKSDAQKIAKRADDIFAIENNYAKTRKAMDASKDANASSRNRIATTDVLVNSVDADGTIRTKQKGGAIDQYRAMTIDNAEGVVSDLLEKEGKTADINYVGKKLMDKIDSSNLTIDEKEAAISGIDRILAGFRRKYPDGQIPLSELQKEKIRTYQNIDYTNTPSKIKQKSNASAYKETIEDLSDYEIKKINEELGQYYNDIELLENLDGRKVKGGKLGKHFSSLSGNVIGAAVGSIGGPLGSGIGSVIGGEVASGIRGQMFKSTFGEAIGKTAEKSKILKEAVEEAGKPRLMLPAPKPGAFRSEIKSGPTIKLPAKSGSTRESEEIAKFGSKVKKYSPTVGQTVEPQYKSALDALRSPEMKEKLAKAKSGQNVSKVTRTSNNLYHTTKSENIDSIIKNGLTAGNKPRFEGVSASDKISFSANESGAKYYGGQGDLMIRTKTSYKPDDLDLDLLAGGEGTYRTGKNIPPDMLEVKIGNKWVDLKEYPLIQEAKKYKSAEEFVKAQGTPVYHGGSEIKEVGNMRSKWDAFYMSDNPTYAKSYGGNKSVLNEMVITSEARLADLRKPSSDIVKQIEDIISPKKTGKTFKIQKPDGSFIEVPETKGGLSNPVHSSADIIQGIKDGKAYYAEMPEVKEALKKLGYDGMITQESKFGANYGVWNKDVIKTKSQLTDIWNKANKK